MKGLLKNGYNAKLRPSGHDISTKFGRDNGGAVPANVLGIGAAGEPSSLVVAANTESNSAYLRSCRDRNFKPHPARFPAFFAEFFIKFLTNEGDLVLDIFAGSNTTGYVAERLGRKWMAFEIRRDYLEASAYRFEESVPQSGIEPIPLGGLFAMERRGSYAASED
jgi:site-specific DNA-methyltransferase (cytosine-N4-specific)